MNTDINAQRRLDAQARADDLAAFVLPLRAEGKSLREIAAALTTVGIPTANGGAWGPKQIHDILHRLKQPADQTPELRDPLADLVVPEQAPIAGGDPLAALPAICSGGNL